MGKKGCLVQTIWKNGWQLRLCSHHWSPAKPWLSHPLACQGVWPVCGKPFGAKSVFRWKTGVEPEIASERVCDLPVPGGSTVWVSTKPWRIESTGSRFCNGLIGEKSIPGPSPGKVPLPAHYLSAYRSHTAYNGCRRLYGWPTAPGYFWDGKYSGTRRHHNPDAFQPPATAKLHYGRCSRRLRPICIGAKKQGKDLLIIWLTAVF